MKQLQNTKTRNAKLNLFFPDCYRFLDTMFSHSFNKFLLSVYYVTGAVWVVGTAKSGSTDMMMASWIFESNEGLKLLKTMKENYRVLWECALKESYLIRRGGGAPQGKAYVRSLSLSSLFWFQIVKDSFAQDSRVQTEGCSPLLPSTLSLSFKWSHLSLKGGKIIRLTGLSNVLFWPWLLSAELEAVSSQDKYLSWNFLF